MLSGFEFVLSSNERQLKKYRIEHSNIRFFDEKGRYIDHRNAIVPANYVSSISYSPNYPSIIDESVDAIQTGNLYIKSFNLMLGEVIVLDDETGIQAGQKLVEGLNETYPVGGVKITYNDCDYEIFSKLPKMLFLSTPDEIGGISLIINGRQNRVCEKEVRDFKLHNDVFSRGYLVDLNEYIQDEGLYQILLSFPKRKNTREIANIAYICDFQYEFINAPYIFKANGEIGFPLQSGIVIDPNTTDGEWERQPSQNVFSFNFGERNHNSENYCNLVENQRLHLQYDLCYSRYDIYFEIPTLFWKYNLNDEWNTIQPADILLKDLGKKQKRLYVGGQFNFANSKIVTTNDVDISEEESEIKYQGGKNGYFDLTRIYEWFRSNRTEQFRKIYISISGKQFFLFNVICKSIIKEVNLFGDFDNGFLKGNVHIEGNETYTISIFYGDSLICEDEPIVNNQFCISTEIHPGDYSLNIYELSEEDDDGFDVDTEVLLLNDKPIIKNLIDVEHLENQKVTICNISDRNGIFRPLLKDRYIIRKLRRVHFDEICEEGGEILGIWDEKIDPYNLDEMSKLIMYKGEMGLEIFDDFNRRNRFNVLIVLKDSYELDSLIVMQEKNAEGYCEYVSLMVDPNMGRIVLEENEYSKLIKSRFLKLVFDDVYKFDGKRHM